MNVYIILGNVGSGKSCTVRALTGRAHEGQVGRFMLANGRTIALYVNIRALQESKLLPAAFIKTMQQAKTTNVLLTLRIKAANGCPDAAAYEKSFRQAGWTIKGKEDLTTFTPTMTDNEKSAKIRKKWGWM